MAAKSTAKRVTLDITKILPYLPSISGLVDAEQQLKRAKTPAARKSAIANLFLALVSGAAPAVSKNNPKHAPLIDDFVKFAGDAAGQWTSGKTDTGTATPNQPAATDPTSTVYDDLDSAKSAYDALSTTDRAMYHIDKRPDGKFQMWSQIGPEPGIRVYP